MDPSTPAAGGAKRRRALFEEALSLIERSYDDDRLTVSDLSQRIFTSRRQLQRAFAEAGTSVQERLHATRMQRSAKLLDDSSLTIAQIARSVGYRQPPQFAKAFRRYYQLTPSEWRSSPKPAPLLHPLPARDEHDRYVEHRLREIDPRFRELEPAA